jgi:Domain of unknown function (DUF5062)
MLASSCHRDRPNSPVYFANEFKSGLFHLTDFDGMFEPGHLWQNLRGVRSVVVASCAELAFALAEVSGTNEKPMKKMKHEAELFKAALLAGVQYAEGRKAVEFESTDSASAKALYIYRLLVHDKVISPMPEDQVGEKTIRHRLATWYARQLPQGHPLLE